MDIGSRPAGPGVAGPVRVGGSDSGRHGRSRPSGRARRRRPASAGGRLAGVPASAGGGSPASAPASAVACCFSTKASSWPISVLAGEVTSASASRAGPSRRPSTWPIRTSRLGSLVMSSTCSGPTTTPSTAPPLIAGFLRVLTWVEISLASSAMPSPPHASRRGPLEVLRQPVHPHVGEDAAGQRVLQHPQPDRLLPQVAAEAVLGDRRPGPSGPGSAPSGCRRGPIRS